MSFIFFDFHLLTRFFTVALIYFYNYDFAYKIFFYNCTICSDEQCTFVYADWLSDK